MSKTICIQYCRNSRMNSVKMQKRNWIERRMCKTNTVSFKHVHFHSPNTDTKNWCNKVQIKFSKKKFVRAMVLALYHSNRVALNTCVYFSFLFFFFRIFSSDCKHRFTKNTCYLFDFYVNISLLTNNSFKNHIKNLFSIIILNECKQYGQTIM